MLRWSLILALSILSSCLLAPCRHASGEEQWFFVWAEQERKDYWIWQGQGTVVLGRRILKARLRSYHGVEIVVRGLVSDGKITAKVSISGSCYKNELFWGTYVERQHPKAQPRWGEPLSTKSIVLTNGLYVLALARHAFEPRTTKEVVRWRPIDAPKIGSGNNAPRSVHLRVLVSGIAYCSSPSNG